jgi:hypothetical protein
MAEVPEDHRAGVRTRIPIPGGEIDNAGADLDIDPIGGPAAIRTYGEN